MCTCNVLKFHSFPTSLREMILTLPLLPMALPFFYHLCYSSSLAVPLYLVFFQKYLELLYCFDLVLVVNVGTRGEVGCSVK